MLVYITAQYVNNKYYAFISIINKSVVLNFVYKILMYYNVISESTMISMQIKRLTCDSFCYNVTRLLFLIILYYADTTLRITCC